MKRLVIVIFLFWALGVAAQGVAFEYPLRTTPLLSGNFAELRATHFHTGIDLKTEGVEGLPVSVVKDGVLERISVSPGGYGHALFVRHNDGTLSVYAHLSAFISEIDKIVRHFQYQKESFAINEDVSILGFRFQKGEIIGYSGNTGSSGGPHLHFELRSRNGNTINPLTFFTIPDRRPPIIRSLYLYEFSDRGAEVARRKVEVQDLGGESYSAGRVTVREGRIGIGIESDDFVEGSWNKLGIYKIELFAGEQQIFSLQMDSLTPGLGSLINEVKDYHLYREGKFVYRTFGYRQNLIPGVRNFNHGFIDIAHGESVEIRAVLKDIRGNSSKLKFNIVGSWESVAVDLQEGEMLLSPGRLYIISEGEFSLRPDSDALYMPVVVKPVICYAAADTACQRAIFSVSEREVPLFKQSLLHVKGEFDDKSVVCMTTGNGRLSPLSTERDGDGLWCMVSTLGSYTVARDTVPPSITWLGVNSGKVRIRIADQFTGIANFRVEVNGKWTLFSYDPKKRLLEGGLNEPTFRSGSNEISVTVSDVVGNVATFATTIVR